MGVDGIFDGLPRSNRSTITPQQRRTALLAKIREAGFNDGFWLGHPVADRFGDDPEARSVYLTGARIGRRDRERDGEE